MHAKAYADNYVTEEEFLALPESHEHIELIDGEVFVAPSPTTRHQFLIRRLLNALEVWVAAQTERYDIGLSPLDVRFGENRILQPDLFVVAGLLDNDQKGPVTTIPLLCVEVMSQRRTYDRLTKRTVYAEAGVPEYWTVEQSGVIERWTGELLSTRELMEAQATSLVLPELKIPIGTLFSSR